MATYHGMTFMECLGCEYRTEDDEEMEMWNDGLLGCPICDCPDLRWGTVGGAIHRKVRGCRMREIE
jgi:hypothetical protein